MEVVALNEREAEDRGQLPADRRLAAAAGHAIVQRSGYLMVEQPRAATREEPDGLTVISRGSIGRGCDSYGSSLK